MESSSIADRVERASPRLLVLGDAILDQFVYGDVQRISPEAPVPVVNVTHERYFAGGAANVMANLAAIGAIVEGLAVVGPDDDSLRLREHLAAAGVHSSHFVMQADWSVPRKCRVVPGRQHALRIDFERRCCINNDTFVALPSAAQRIIPECDAVIISDYGKGTLTPLLIQSIVALARDHGRPVIVDPKGRDATRYASATVLTPNQAETEALTGRTITGEESLLAAARELRCATGAEWIVITRGDQGMAVVGDEVAMIPPHAVSPQDVSGAGDTVVAAIAFGLAAGLSLPQSALIANALAAQAVEQSGIATPSRAQLLTAAAGVDAPDSTIVARRDVRRLAEQLKRLGRRIVFTNGCFDVLHRGHLEYLQQSRALGDVLVVGINTDDSVRRLKGPQRPLNSELDRAGVVAALRCVDFVVLFDEDTPYQLIQELRPDVLTKGGDYDRAAVVGRDLVAETHVLGLVPGRSTSLLIDKVRHRTHDRPIDVAVSETAAASEHVRWQQAPPAVAAAQTGDR